MVQPGSVCFAKVKGYSPWPARVNILPSDVIIPRGRIPVFFFGTHEVSYVSNNDIFEYEKYKEIYGSVKDKNGKLKEGIKELETNPTILQLGFDSEAVKFLSQFYRFDEIKAEATFNINVETEKIVSVISNKRSLRSPIDTEAKKQKIVKLSKPILSKEGPETKKLRKILPKTTIVPIKVSDMKKLDMIIQTIPLMSNDTSEKERKELNKNLSLIPLPLNECLEPDILNIVSQTTLLIPTVNQEETTKEICVKDPEEECIQPIHQDDTEKSILEIPALEYDDETTQPMFSDEPDECIPELYRHDHPIDREKRIVQEIDWKSLVLSHCEDLKSASDVKPSFISPVENIDIKRPKRASAIKFKETLQSYVREINQKPNDDEVENNVHIPNKVKPRKVIKQHSLNQTKKSKEHLVAVPNRTQSVDQCPAPIVLTEEEKSLRIVSQMSIIDKEIKRSLTVGHENHDNCRKLIDKLDNMKAITLILLCKVPEIITTIRKCRRYKKDDIIRTMASKIYLRFYKIYELSNLDEKIEAGTELLKRDPGSCKSAQTMMDELFIVNSKTPTRKHFLPSIAVSSPSSAPSMQSSSDNTPLFVPEQESSLSCHFDHVLDDINELLISGSLQLIEYYDDQNGMIVCSDIGDHSLNCRYDNNRRGLYNNESSSVIGDIVG